MGLAIPLSTAAGAWWPFTGAGTKGHRAVTGRGWEEDAPSVPGDKRAIVG